MLAKTRVPVRMLYTSPPRRSLSHMGPCRDLTRKPKWLHIWLVQGGPCSFLLSLCGYWQQPLHSQNHSNLDDKWPGPPRNNKPVSQSFLAQCLGTFCIFLKSYKWRQCQAHLEDQWESPLSPNMFGKCWFLLWFIFGVSSPEQGVFSLRVLGKDGWMGRHGDYCPPQQVTCACRASV